MQYRESVEENGRLEARIQAFAINAQSEQDVLNSEVSICIIVLAVSSHWYDLVLIGLLSLTHSQMTDFRLFQTETVYKPIGWKLQKVLQTGRKHCGKRRIACYEQFLLFPQCFQKTCSADM